jgi:hypothetical protein
MGYRRGFKTEASSLALDIRGELGLGPLDRLDPFCLANHLEIPVICLSDMLAEAPAVAHLLHVETSVFSAVTVFRGSERTIVHNDGHGPARQNHNICHELAHGILLHPPTPALDDRGCREWIADVEDEASWLAGVLLVTEDATIAVAQGTWTRAEAEQHFGVSRQLLQFRMNMTGAVKRVQRTKSA